eukprot:6184124-Pleurochrysis_carterae.AAC.1
MLHTFAVSALACALTISSFARSFAQGASGTRPAEHRACEGALPLSDAVGPHSARRSADDARGGARLSHGGSGARGASADTNRGGRSDRAGEKYRDRSRGRSRDRSRDAS